MKRLGLLVLALAAVSAAAVYSCRGPADTRSPVIIITVDTTRMDHFGCYGNEVVKTPNIDRLAEDSVLFDNCFSTAHSTNPSHTSIFTSLYMKDHGVINNFTKLGECGHILPRVFQDAGYRTVAFTSAHLLSFRAGLDQGYDEFYGCEPKPGSPVTIKPANLAERTAEQTNAYVLDWLDRNRGEDFFLWVHYFDPHMLYTPPAPYDTMYTATSDESLSDVEIRHMDSYAKYFEQSDDLEHYRNLYKGEVSYLDHQLGILFDKLKEIGVYDDCTIVLVADHGESLGENAQYFMHNNILYDSCIRVPLIIKAGGESATGHRRQLVSSVDIYPTVLELSGLGESSPIRGMSLVPLIEEEDAPEIRDEVVSQGIYEANVSIRTRDYQYFKVFDPYTSNLSQRGIPPEELYMNVPGQEQVYSARADDPHLTEELEKKVDEYMVDRIRLVESEGIDDAEYEKKLKSLGYVH